MASRGNAVIGGVGSCPLTQLVCPSSRGDGTDNGVIARRELDDGTAAAHNFHGVIDEVEEVAAVLWKYHDLLYTTFTYYAALSKNSIFAISQNALSALVEDAQLDSKTCTPALIGQV